MNKRLNPKFQLNLEIGKLPWQEDPSIVLLMSQDIHGDKKWKAIGTAFPVLHQGLNLITAAHVVKNLSGNPLKAIHKGYEISLEHSQTIFNSDIDIAIIQSDSEILNKLFNPCRVIEPLNKQDSNDSTITSIYQVYGFPVSKNKYSPNKKLTPQAFRLSLGESKKSPESSSLTKLKIPLLHFKLDDNNLLDDKLMKSNILNRFEGFSGGPVICTSVETRLGSLIGMFVEWDNRNKIATVLPWIAISSFLDLYA